MELKENSRKRKAEENSSSMENMNQDVLERVLSWLPTSDFFRLTSVSKRWKSAADSATFKLACAEIPSRDPWFLMIPSSESNHTSIVFDSADKNWKNLRHVTKPRVSMPVAASGGLVCFRDRLGNFQISNPLTGSVTPVPPLDSKIQTLPLHAVVMTKTSNKLAVVFGEVESLSFRLYDPKTRQWEKEVPMKKRQTDGENSAENGAVFFLNKTGEVVSLSPEMHRSPCKQYSSVSLPASGDGCEERVCFVSASGRVVECGLEGAWFGELPRLLPALSEYSVDVVECGGRLVVVLLAEFWESASVRAWGLEEGEWRQVAAMPAAMSHRWFGRKADVNCVGAGGGRIMVCLSSGKESACVLCDVETNEWTELDRCRVGGEVVEFVSAFSFEPRIEACV